MFNRPTRSPGPRRSPAIATPKRGLIFGAILAACCAGAPCCFMGMQQSTTRDRVKTALNKPPASPAPVADTDSPPEAPFEPPPPFDTARREEISFADPYAEVLARMNDCDQAWRCHMDPSSSYASPIPPWGGHPSYLSTAKRPIDCTIPAFDEFSVYVAVDPESLTIDVSHISREPAFALLLSDWRNDLCDTLLVYEENLNNDADDAWTDTSDFLLDQEFEEEAEEDCYSYVILGDPAEPAEWVESGDSGDSGEQLPAPESEMLSNDVEYVICLDAFALSYTISLSQVGCPPVEAVYEVDYPSDLPAAVQAEVDEEIGLLQQ